MISGDRSRARHAQHERTASDHDRVERAAIGYAEEVAPQRLQDALDDRVGHPEGDSQVPFPHSRIWGPSLSMKNRLSAVSDEEEDQGGQRLEPLATP